MYALSTYLANRNQTWPVQLLLQMICGDFHVSWFSLLSLTGSSKIHFKLILKAKSEANCILTGEKCQWRNAFGAAASR